MYCLAVCQQQVTDLPGAQTSLHIIFLSHCTTWQIEIGEDVVCRYQQVISMCGLLGRCLALVATGAVPAALDCAVVPVPDPALVQVDCPCRLKA